ncbi:uncharacterized protein LOC115327890 [Ixodes scapularis]|uniref:uncharacterized protein LOC115327890 n=1 Tax=Ixodes scapularis TaxID=6945 RepID=UPI001C38DE94|nr:uncharacterized protein LOC115327890 [Ixodes scapularis]
MVPYSSSAVGVQTKLLEIETLPANDITSKLVAFSADNTNCNFGGSARNGKNNVFARMQDASTHKLIGIGCEAYIVHNTIKTAADCLPTDIEAVIVKIYSYFYIYTVRVESFKEFCDFASVEYQRLLGYKKCLSLIKTFFEDACGELWLYFLHSQAAMFQATVLQIEGDSKTAIEVHKVLNQLQTKVQDRLQQGFLPSSVRFMTTTLEEQGEVRRASVTEETYKKAKRKATEGLENSCLESTDVGEPDDGATGKDNTAYAPVRLSVPIPPTGLGGACARAPPKRRAPDPPSRAPDPPSSKGWSKESRAPTSPLAERQAPRRRNLEAAEVVEATMSPFQSELLKVLLDVQHEVHLLRQDTAQVLANQEQLAVRIAQLERTNCPPDAPVPPAVFILPLATMEDFEAADRRLINPADQAVLKEQLSGLGGTTIAEAMRRTLERLLRKQVQMHFSICGRRGNKQPFRGTQLCAVAVGKVFSFHTFIAN